MVYKRLMTGMFSSNCYIIGDNGEGAVIDPGVECGEIMAAVEELGLRIKYIILTHVHIDHICHMDELREKTGANVAAHADDAVYLSNPRLNGSALFGLAKAFGNADITVKDGDVLKVGGMDVHIIHTPGHSAGGICIKAENRLFSGDTLFRMSIGRTDLGNGDYDELINSIKTKLMVLDDEVEVYPGHGTATTIGYERANNPFISG
ncbi:glyoxylase-like metal-dependent hydrolase (beta-lactamase superfamily II) [Anaerobacterium chartisolvens]|uniref:Glyoxylase-like metal-dependent hydrolase (Beta-lactamase superfamily II) n=1 Tax=Anaerobacterium chartisolvens TaxID=1297424 RepID=A0A369B8V7_9FIRM|nr:MBL fold metallo-hydrolase [Anaerobacterium chartisolvens]RCX17963.1 glyoxylase-like metal-dependent hydrolase (beta-lactamase superfamily II) [Anaerobacterium chartisolvens]